MMEYCRITATTILNFLIFCAHPSSPVTHSLQYVYTGVTPGLNLPEFTAVGLVDGELSEYYDSNIKRIVPRTEWIKKVDSEDPHYWHREAQYWITEQEWLKNDIIKAMKYFNQTKGIHTVQLMFGCEIDDDGTTREFSQFGYDGEDFLSLDRITQTWTATSANAVTLENKWNPTGHDAKDCTLYLKSECVFWLKKFVSYGKETLERKVPPEASLLQKHSEVVCHATGFFPKSVMITWKKDGEDVYEDVDIRDTLTNHDGSFQKRSVLKVPAEDLQKHNYTCVIQHSSLQKELVLEVPKEGGLDAALFVVIIGLGFLILMGVAAGIIHWINSINSGFNVLPPGASSEGNSSSSNS